jgi:hypothetical protein
MYMDRETWNPIHSAFSKATLAWIVCTPMWVDFGIESLSIVSICLVAKHPEDSSKIDETSTCVFSNEVHSICFVHKDHYISWPPLGNLASAQNQMMILLDDDTQQKIRNPTCAIIVLPTIVSENPYKFS